MAVAMAVVAWDLGPPWWLVVLVLVAPDLSSRGLCASGRARARAVYNAAHTYLGPAVARRRSGSVAGSMTAADGRARSGRSTSASTARSGFGLKYRLRASATPTSAGSGGTRRMARRRLPLPDDGKLAANIAHFARALRKAGLPVGTGRVLDAIRAVEAAGFADRRDFYYTLAGLLRQPARSIARSSRRSFGCSGAIRSSSST